MSAEEDARAQAFEQLRDRVQTLEKRSVRIEIVVTMIVGALVAFGYLVARAP